MWSSSDERRQQHSARKKLIACHQRRRASQSATMRDDSSGGGRFCELRSQTKQLLMTSPLHRADMDVWTHRKIMVVSLISRWVRVELYASCLFFFGWCSHFKSTLYSGQTHLHTDLRDEIAHPKATRHSSTHKMISSRHNGGEFECTHGGTRLINRRKREANEREQNPREN